MKSPVPAPKVAMLVILCAFLATMAASSRSADTSPAVHDPQKAAPFSLQRLDGKTFRLSAHRGKVIVLNFWATWCGPCRKEVPDFVELQKELEDEGLLIAGISVDQGGENAVRKFAGHYDMNYPVMIDDGTVSRMYGPIRAVPTNVIIGREGYIRYYIPGRLPKERMEKLIMGLLSEQ